jgi:hypothetical protein
MHLSVVEITLIATFFSYQDPLSMLLVIMPVSFILIVFVILGINHLAFALSFSIHQLTCVETSVLVLLDSLIRYIASLILSVLNILLVICQISSSRVLNPYIPSLLLCNLKHLRINILYQIILALFLLLLMLATQLLLLLLLQLRRSP